MIEEAQDETRLQSPFHLNYFACIITSGLLLFGTIDVTQGDPPACEQQFKRECSPRKEAPKPGLICPSPRQPCPLDETETGTTEQ